MSDKLDSISPRSALDETVKPNKRNKCCAFFKDNWFVLTTLLGVCIGFAIAFGVRAAHPGPTAVLWISMPGDIYLRLLQLTILPLIASNILVVVATLDPKKNGRMSIISLAYVVLIDLVSAAIGTTLASIIKPGSRNFNSSISGGSDLEGTGLDASDVFKDIFKNLFPSNIVGVAIYQFRTEVEDIATGTKIEVSNKNGTNMIGVLFCAFTFGTACNMVGEKAKPFLNFFEALSLVVTRLMSTFLLLTPIGVTFMVAGSVVDRVDIKNDFIQLGIFIATVLTGLIVHFFLIHLVLWAASKKNPFRLLRFSAQPVLISFATTSTAVAIPETYKSLDKYGVSEPVSRFVAPLCAAMKGDGSAIFITSAALFVTQQTGIPVSIDQVFIILFLTFASVLSIPNIPSASMVLLVTVLSSIGVPTEGAGLLFAMEWFLDRCRTASGGLSTLYIAATTQAILDRTRPKGEDNFDEFEIEEANRNGIDRSEKDFYSQV